MSQKLRFTSLFFFLLTHSLLNIIHFILLNFFFYTFHSHSFSFIDSKFSEIFSMVIFSQIFSIFSAFLYQYLSIFVELFKRIILFFHPLSCGFSFVTSYSFSSSFFIFFFNTWFLLSLSSRVFFVTNMSNLFTAYVLGLYPYFSFYFNFKQTKSFPCRYFSCRSNIILFRCCVYKISDAFSPANLRISLYQITSLSFFLHYVGFRLLCIRQGKPFLWLKFRAQD